MRAAAAPRLATLAAATAAAAAAAGPARGFSTTPAALAGNKVPKPTAQRDTSLTRNPAFKALTDADVAHFKSILPASAVVHAADPAHDDLLPYNMDWMRKYRGQATVVLKPQSTDQVAAIMRYCSANRLAVVPQGGNTGLVGGSVPVFDEVVVNLSNLNKVRSFDPVSGVVVADAGCILEVLDNYVAQRGHMMPLDLGAKGSCHIGGNVATNAGGLRLLRYGSLHGSVLGIEAVLPDGTVLDNLTSLRKDNTGLDLKQLFIGSEGVLGIITAVAVLTPVRPRATHVATLAVDDYAGVQAAFLAARRDLGETLSAFEFWDTAASELVESHLPWLRNPLRKPKFQILIETAGADADHNTAKLDAYLEQLLENGVAVDGAVAQDGTQSAAMWSIRESIPEACSKDGAVFKYDVSMPVPVLYELVEATRQRMRDLKVPGVRSVIGYGHVGDGNLHLNVSADDYSPEVVNALEPFIYEWVAQHRGSISAEHGLGLMKPRFLHYSKDAVSIATMRAVKQLFDPHGIMNPYKYLPDAPATTAAAPLTQTASTK
ncbi:D-lactate ferricytochrome c oxidoreductase [Blastocladiella emersonii ATCC 22665]|nr:D-lactate ferricytochrome c oxidoreductase [Blastocladiella emersonii ATCC 22665]